jgi:ATP-dependent exoDNAse (exonuclease V) beta subunit
MLEKIVNASAGTGKTFTVLDRAIDILDTGKSEEDIKKSLETTLFLSFSNAAVEEMKDRVVEKLLKFKKSSGSPLIDSIKQGSMARIYTIHSFALELTRVFRYELGLPPGMEFVPVEDMSLWAEAVREFYRKEWSREKLAESLGLDSGTGRDCLDIFFILSDQKSIKQFLMKRGANIFFINALDKKDEAVPDKDRVKAFLEGIGADKDREKALYSLKEQLDSMEEDIKQALVDIKKYEKAGVENKTDKSRAENIAKAQKAREDILKLIEPFETAADMMSQCSWILGAIARRIGEAYYMPMQYTKAVFDFDAVVFMAVSFIQEKGRKWFVDRMKREGLYFENLVIDEAQDNDIVQNYFVSILAGKDTDKDINVTVVGDMKQSIYQFRNAYPEEFRALYEEAKKAGKSMDLQKTRRLQSVETVDFINTFFEKASGMTDNAWDYVKERDELKPNPEKETPGKPVIKLVRLYSDKSLETLRGDINAFVKEKKAGILVRSRGGLTRTGLKGIIDDGFKYRVKMDKGEVDLTNKDFDMKESQQPEYYLLRSILYSQSADTIGLVPFFMNFTLPGALLKDKIKRVKKSGADLQGIKDTYHYASEIYRTYGSGSIARTAYRLAESFGLWKYMYHADENGTPEHLRPEMIARNINSVLSEIYLFERQMKSSYYTAEDIVTGIAEADYAPYEWYALPDTITGSGVEVTTIHSSKGLQYDSVIVAADFNDLLSTKEDFKSDDFEFMYSVKFGNISNGMPEIKMDFFPYFGKLTAKVMRDVYECGRELYKGSLGIYEEVKKRQISEKLNLVYVALTRTKKDLLLIDLSAAKESTGAESILSGLLEGVLKPETGLAAKQEKPAGKEVWFVELNGEKSILKPAGSAAVVTARDMIMEEKELHFRGGKKLTQAEREMNMEVGTTVHEMLEHALKGGIKPDSIDSALAGSAAKVEKGAPEYEKEQRAAKILTSRASVEELKDKFKSIEGWNMRPEVPVWGMSRDGRVIKGVMDGLAEKDGKYSVIEYKTIFGDETAQKELCQEQLRVYGGFVEEIKGKEPEKISVMLRADLTGQG